jgi:hypothetical protein
MYRVICFLIIVSFLGIGSCKKKVTDPDYCSTAWALQLSTEITALTNAAIVYTNDPTVANCNSYKAAYQDYLNALKPFLNCALWSAAEKTELQNEIADAESEISTMCN